MTSIQADSLSKRYGNVHAVDGLSLAVQSGEVVGLLGANGAGKTTTMKMLLGLLTPSSGIALIAGQPVRSVDRRSMGYVPQGLGLYRDLTVSENVAFAAASFGVVFPDLERAGLADVADQRIGRLSLGTQRRVAFLVARAHDPSVLILDEPTSGVGPLGRARLWETIRETAASGAAVLVSTHHMDEAEECDRVVLVARGRGVASGSVKEVIAGAVSVSVSGDVTDESLKAVAATGATVLSDGPDWRVVGADRDVVAGLVGPSVRVSEVPATFEEAFVVLSS